MSSGADIRRDRFRAGAVILAFVAAYYVAQALASFAFMVWVWLTEGPDQDLDVLLESGNSRVSVLYGALLVVVYGLYIWKHKQTRPGFVLFRKPRPGQIGSAAILSLGMLGTANGLFLLVTWLASLLPPVQTTLDRYNDLVGDAFALDTGLIWTLAGICILVPIAEELLFRGIVQNELRGVFSEKTAILIQALLFSAFHLQLVQSVYVFIPGLVMGLVYYSTRSLYLPILMHMLFNFFGSGVFYALTDAYPIVQNGVYLAQYVCILAGIALLAGLLRQRRLRTGTPRPD